MTRMYYNLANMTYCNMTNKELLDAYNASAEYDESMKTIITRIATILIV